MQPTRRPIVVSERPGLRFERSLPAAGRDGLTFVHQRLESRGVIERSIVTGACWIFAAVTDETGLTEARSGACWVALPRRRAFLIPPRSLIRLRLTDVTLEAHGVIGRVALPAQLALPCAAELMDAERLPHTVSEIAAALSGHEAFDPDAGASQLACEIHRRLQSLLGHPSPVRAIARDMHLAPDTISRVFRGAYQLTPKAYVQGARVSDAVLSLCAGVGVLRAGLEARFNDVSRFYEVFRRLTGNTPGEYAALHDRKPRRQGPDITSP